MTLRLKPETPLFLFDDVTSRIVGMKHPDGKELYFAGSESSAMLPAAQATALPGVWQVIAHSAVAVPLTGTTAETALATISIPAAAMGANGLLRVTTDWSHTNNANGKSCRVRLGGLAGTAFMAVVETTGLAFSAQKTICNRGAFNSQVTNQAVGATGPFAAGAASAHLTAAVDMSVAKDLVISGELGNSGDTLTLEQYTVELCYRA